MPPPSPMASLVNGFWPATCIQRQENVPLSNDRTLREEFAEDKPFIGAVGEQPRPSFQVARDVYRGYMLFIHPGDETNPKPVWVVLAISDLVLTSTSEHFQKIKV